MAPAKPRQTGALLTQSSPRLTTFMPAVSGATTNAVYATASSILPNVVTGVVQ